ncbi:MAG TPA: DUF4159 domain-containing protein [Vicinamibacterales bacterium]|nr:DUF4159 domain-containing protein [Vicinamibacterales bacterium]
MKKILACLLVAIAGAAAAAAAQQRFGVQRTPQNYDSVNVGYDGRLAFVRLRYATGFSGFGRRGRGGELPWAHDYPTADIHLMKIVNDLTTVGPHIDGSNIYSLDDPELMDHPIAYMSEPGFWTLSDTEAEGLRTYLRKGGFIIFDDFRGRDWYNLEEQMKRVLPDAYFVQLDGSHPVFNTFFEIKNLEFLQSYNGQPTYWGIFEDNDPRKRLIAIANRDNDLGEYWEYSDTGWDPVDFSNEAFKFGVNYFIYGLTR